MTKKMYPDWSMNQLNEINPTMLADHVESIYNDLSNIFENMNNYQALYLGRNTIERDLMDINAKKPAKMNIIASVADTVINRIASRQIRPMIISTGGEWENRLKSITLQKYTDAVMYREKYQQRAREALKDAGIKNIGYIGVCYDGKDIKIETINPKEIIIDDDQSKRGCVKELFRRKEVPKHELIRMFPNIKDKLGNHSTLSKPGYEENFDTGIILVYEAWRVADSIGPGVHCLFTSEIHLEDPEEYKYDYFPIVPLRTKLIRDTWFGQGYAEFLYENQNELDAISQRIKNNQGLFGDPPILWDVRGGSIPDHFLQKGLGKVWPFDSSKGHPPDHVVKPTISPEFYNWQEQIAKWCYDTTGVSQLSAQGNRPSGNDLSGLAFKVLEDIQSLRLSELELTWQNLGVEIAKRIIDISADVFKGGKKVKYISKDFIETIDFKDASMSQHEYELKIAPASIWPETIAGKLSTAQELKALGFHSDDEIRAQLHSPELDRPRSYADGPINSIYIAIDEILYKGNKASPTKYDNLELAIKTANDAYHDAKVNGCPPDRLAELLNYIDKAAALLVEATPPPQMMPSGLPGQPIPGQQAEMSPQAQAELPKGVPLPAVRQ